MTAPGWPGLNEAFIRLSMYEAIAGSSFSLEQPESITRRAAKTAGLHFIGRYSLCWSFV
jgi:hypothetical protein